MRIPSIGGVILAGGKSSRMGQPKELLPWKEGTLIAHLHKELTGAGLPCLIVSHAPETIERMGGMQADAAVDVVRDQVPSCGPISGIVTAFRLRSEEVLLVLSCDLPFVEQKHLKKLIDYAAQQSDWDAVVVKTGDRVHPLLALYHRRSQPYWEEALSAGQYRLMEVLQKLRIVWTPPDLLDAWAAYNANTPEEYRCALEEKKKRESASL
ncbi:molybdenum cofactor guanylyltransferase [Brevibacillus ruminantium]|uniref:Probable molybdenum cofactor guanylyltransferase n=1 Tax=Brevibacillus ruminantium TaxID=2950604 RepID=A0ABY4WMW1_9BACL|nr:molybdenum cofactor guanylyltransferase [Brevibacillus ruminantium]USG68487.1 molybdenum cofactor guanylyltransferase [Brevibacillus ruminantium]